MRNKILEFVVAVFIVFIITKPNPKLLVLPPTSQESFQQWRVFASNWGAVPPKPKVYLAGDLNRDHVVNFRDLNILAQNWLKIDLHFIAKSWLQDGF